MKNNGFGNVMKKAVSMTVTVSLLAAGMQCLGGKNGMDTQGVLHAKESGEIEMRLQYDEPAADWESEALPIGNGNMGAAIFGGVGNEKIQVNEETLWSGGPGASSSYAGGDTSASVESVHEALMQVRRSLQDMVTDFADNKAAYRDDAGNLVTNDYTDLTQDNTFMSALNRLKGSKSNFGSYQTLGNIYLRDNSGSDSEYFDYLRTSDIDNAIETVTYVQDGVTYNREYFMSNPADVMVMKYTADGRGKINRDIYIESEQTKKTISIDEENASITMTGQPSDQGSGGLRFAQYVRVIADGGEVEKGGDASISVHNADSITVIMSAATNYQVDYGTTYNYFSDDDPLDKAVDSVEAAAVRSYDSLKQEHVADYRKLYDRVSMNVGVTETPDKMTDVLLADYNKNNTSEEDRYLEMLFFQYGRYLLISSSRENSVLPANLQGIWAQGLSPAWSSDFHTNINLQMNYWLAEQTNLTECHIPAVNYTNSLVAKGTEIAQKFYCRQDGGDVRGWVIHHENNIWGNAAPSDYTTAFYFPAAAAWMCQDIWEKYAFNSDRNFLEDNYQTMLDAALFWVDNLWVDERDGKLVANPSYSPEHGVFSIGCSSDQAIIWELFEEVIKAAEILGKENDSEINEVKEAQKNLYMPSAGMGGQLAEWKDETTLEVTNYDNHRHQNHLSVLHPGTYVIAGRSEWDDEMVEAARVTLEKRGDGGTGWSKAWKINMWARLRDGNRAHKLLGEQLTGSTLKNLYDTHPPFQIDGNFGATSGVAEMLLQSQGDSIEPLAAIPDVWGDGYVNGLKARGNFEVGMKWSSGSLDSMNIISGSGNECSVKYEGIAGMKIFDNTAYRYVDATVTDNDMVKFNTVAGHEYMLARNIDIAVPSDAPAPQPEATAVTTPATAAPELPGSAPSAETGTSYAAPKTITSGQIVYNVLSGGRAEAVRIKPGKKTVIIPAAVRDKGVSYKVTGIASGAAKGNGKVTRLVIGKNIVKIGKNAFADCVKLKQIDVKTVNLSSVGKKAFYNTAGKIKVTVNKKNMKKYKKMFRKGGISGKAKYTAK